MKIRITWLATGAVLDLQESDSILGPQTTFLELKGFIKMRYGFKPQQLLLVCDQVLCEDDESLKQYGIVSSETAEKKVIGCHVFSMEEAEKEQKELEQEKAFEEEQKKRDAKRAEEAKKRREQQQEKDGVDSTKQDDDDEGQESANDSNKNKKTTSILSYNHEDYQKALKILGKEKVAVSKARMSEVAHGNAPTHRPKFLDEQKSAKQMQMLQQAAKDAENAFASSSAGGGNSNNNSTFTTGGAPNYMDMVRTSEEWRGREAEKLRRIFKFAEYGDRRKEADEFFKIDYPNYPEGAIELWDVREDIMASIASGADQKPLIIELFYFCELEKGVDMQKLGELVQMKLEQRGLRVKILGVREAGCTYPLVAVAVTGETPAEIFQLGEVFFEEFGNPDAVSTEQGMKADGGAPAPQEGCVVQ